jgi:hypothetical protein
LDHVAAIGSHHSTELRNYHVEKSVQIDGSREGGGQTIDDRLACLVHSDPAFERERLLSFCHFRTTEAMARLNFAWPELTDL